MSAFTAVNVREEQAPQDLWSGAEPTEENPDGEYPPVAEEPMDEDEAVADHEDEDEDDDDAAVSEDERDVDDDQADDDDDQVDHGVLEDDSEPEIDIDESLDMDDSFVDDQALDGARPPPELVVSTENVQRFKARITHILKGIKTVIDEMDPFNEKWEGHYDWTNAPVTFRFWDFLRRVSVEVLFDCILKGASPQVKHVLGKLRWTLQDLSSLPPASAQTEKGIYTGIVLTSSNIDNYDVYVGSSLRSVARRVREHVSAMRVGGPQSCRFYDAARRSTGVQFKSLLAITHENHPYILLAESVMMIYLQSFQDNRLLCTKWAPPSCFLLCNVSRPASLPSVAYRGLNGALSIKQGFRIDRADKVCAVCHRTGQELKDAGRTLRWSCMNSTKPFMEYRCSACARFHYGEGVDKTPEQVNKTRWRTMKPDHCANCNKHLSPTDQCRRVPGTTSSWCLLCYDILRGRATGRKEERKRVEEKKALLASIEHLRGQCANCQKELKTDHEHMFERSTVRWLCSRCYNFFRSNRKDWRPSIKTFKTVNCPEGQPCIDCGATESPGFYGMKSGTVRCNRCYIRHRKVEAPPRQASPKKERKTRVSPIGVKRNKILQEQDGCCFNPNCLTKIASEYTLGKDDHVRCLRCHGIFLYTAGERERGLKECAKSHVKDTERIAAQAVGEAAEQSEDTTVLAFNSDVGQSASLSVGLTSDRPQQADAPSTATMNSKRDLEGDDSSSPDPVQKRVRRRTRTLPEEDESSSTDPVRKRVRRRPQL